MTKQWSRTGAVLGSVLLVSVTVIVSCTTMARPGAVPPPVSDLGGKAYDAALRVKLPEAVPEDDKGLHNLFRLSDQIVSGAEPEGEAAFQKLHQMGIHTILSVDGKVPDAALAAKYDMRYVHVPIQYSGITKDEMAKITKTFREQEGPFYVHCFHGKHRGPAAAAVGRVALDGASREQALAEMRQWCGTAPTYEGLYRSIAQDWIPGPEESAQYGFDFAPAAKLEGFRQGMIEAARAHDNVKYLAKNQWQPSVDHPDIDALNEATKLASILSRTHAVDSSASRPADFQEWMAQSVEASARLRDGLRARDGKGPTAELDRLAKEIANTCSACHAKYRN